MPRLPGSLLMTKPELTKLLAEIKDRQLEINRAEVEIEAVGRPWLEKICDQGFALIRLKNSTERGQFMLSCEKVGVGAWYARAYMAIARNKELINAKGLKGISSALHAIAYTKRGESAPAKVLRPFTEILGSLGNALNRERRFPFEHWPEGAQEACRNELLPFALKLWPNGFPPPKEKPTVGIF